MATLRRCVPAVFLVLVCVLFLRAAIPHVASGTWTDGAKMSVARTGATATLMPDGRVLIAGGKDADGNALASAELFNTDGTITPAPAMATPRYGHSAMFLLHGFVLVAGGHTTGGGVVNTAELFDPITNTWQTLAATMADPRADFTLSQLPDGNVLVAGGDNGTALLSSIENFDLMTNTFSYAGTMNTARKAHAAAVLDDGRVLVSGGLGIGADGTTVALGSTEIYDPKTGAFTAGPILNVARYGHTATTLLDGQVLIAGGNSGSAELASTETFYPSDNSVVLSASMAVARSGHSALRLPNNNAVLMTGGTSAGTALASSELYQSWNAAFAQTGAMSAARSGSAITALGNGSYIGIDGLALIAGGSDLNSTELYGFATLKTDKDEYAPGTPVVMTGSGWKPGETVTLSLTEDPLVDTHPNIEAVADANGNIETSDFAPDDNDLGIRFHLTAVGTQSGLQAQTKFRDNKLLIVNIAGTGAGTIQITDTTDSGANHNCPNVTAGGVCNVSVGNNDVGTIAATAASGSVFGGWSSPTSGVTGCVSTPTATCNFSMSNNGQQVTATFNAISNVGTVTVGPQTGTLTYGTAGSVTYSVTVTRSGSGSGAFSANLTATLPTGVSASFATNPLVFAAGDNSKSTTLTLTSTATAQVINAVSFSVKATNALAPTDFASGTSTLTIGPKTISPSITASNKVYDGNTNATFTCSLSGVVGTDSVSCAGGTATFATKTVANGKTVTATGLALTGTAAGNYVLSPTSATGLANITAKGLTITGVAGVDKVYDATTNATLNSSGASLVGVVSGDVVAIDSSSAVGTFANKNVGSPVAITTTGYSLTGADSGNYTVAQPSTSANITPKALTITGLTASNKIYDATTVATVTGNADPDTAEAPGSGNSLDGKPYTGDVVNMGGTPAGTFATANVGNGIAVSASGINLGGSAQNNYTLSPLTLHANITPKALTVTGLTANNKTYDATTNATFTGTPALQTAEAAGAGTTADGKPYTVDAVSVTGTPTGTFASKNFGTAITVSVTGLSLTGTGTGNYSLTQPSLSANITKKALTYTGLSVAASKIYDGTNSATVSGSAALQAAETPGTGSAADGKPYSGDTVGLTGTPAATYDSKDVANATQVTFGGVSLNGTDAVNYTLTALTQAATITQKALTYSGVSVPSSREYDGTKNAVVSGTPVLQSAEEAGTGSTADGKPYSVDAVSLTGTVTATYNTKDVATANLVTFAGASLTGTGSANYSLTALTQAATITARDLHVTGVTANPKAYDGTVAATLNTSGAALVTVVAGDSVTLNSGSATGAFVDKNVGNNKAVTVSGLTLTGTDAPNYNLLQPTDVAGSITPAHLTVTGDNASRTYGDANPTFTATLSGFVPGENLANSGVTGSASCTTAATTNSPVPGPYAITCTAGSLTATNYDFTTFNPGQLTITARHITVTAEDKTKTYGDADPAFTYTIGGSGLATGDTIASVFTGSLQRASGETVVGSPYAVNQGTLAANSNYLVATFTAGHLTITPRTASVTPNAATKIYGDPDPAFTGTLTGFLTGDGVSATYNRTAGETVAGGPYTISATLAPAGVLSNYTITYNTANFTITPRAASVTPAAAGKTYGDADPAFTGTLTGFVAADGVTATYSRTSGDTVAGSPYTISATLAPAGVLGNYSITHNTASFTISPKPASVTPNAASKTYGDADPALTGTLLGFLPGDNVSATYGRAAGETVLGGPYTISATLSPAGVLDNYAVTYNSANFTINPKAASVTPNAASKTYGDADPALSGTLAGFLAGDNVTAAYSRTAGETVTGGPYTISATLSPAGVLSNYNITFNTALFTISPKAASVTPNAASKTYGDADPAFSGTLTGFLVADGVTATYSRTAGETVSGGPYTISATLAPAGVLSNYNITYNTANFTINPRPASVTPDAATKMYGAADPALTGTLAGFLTGDGVTATYSRTTGETVAGSPYTISATLAPASVLSNYTITYNTASFTITPRPITVTPDAGQHKTYGDADPVLTFSVGGSGLAGWDTQSTSFTGVLARASGEHVVPAGYLINQGSLTANSNYTITSFATGVTFMIDPRAATVTANNKSKTYGDANPALDATATNTVNGDVLNYTLATTATQLSGVGNYPITVTLGSNPDYNVTKTDGTLTINQRVASVTPNAASKTYGDADPTFTGTLTNFLASDNVTATYSRTAGETVLGGPYVISAVLSPTAVLSNYAITYNTATFTITPKAASVTPNPATKIFGNPDPSPLTTGTLSGFLNADNVTATYSRASGETVGTYTISATLSPTAALSNYTITYNTAQFTITAWTLAGFYQPVTPYTGGTVVWNTVKGGSTVPIKFNVYAGTVPKTDVSAVKTPTGSLVPSIALYGASCGAGGVEDPIDYVANSGSTLLRFDSTGGQFIQNWQTPKGANQCYFVQITTQDGSTLQAYFKTK